MSELPRRRMGRTQMRPRALGMGAAFAIHAPEAETIATVERALELGIDFFDTYPSGQEERWGKALAGVERSNYYLQAKIGPHPDRYKDFSGEAARWSVENSLRLLRVDYLDSVLVHDPMEIEDPLGPGRACRDHPDLPRLHPPRPVRRADYHAAGQTARRGPDPGQRLRHGEVDGRRAQPGGRAAGSRHVAVV